MEIYYSKSKLVKTFLLALVMTFAALFVAAKVFFHLFVEARSIVSSVSISDFVAFLGGTVSVFGILIFGAAAIDIALRFFHSEAQVIISLNGIEDKRLNTGLIEWNDVALVIFSKDKYSQLLSLTLYSPEKHRRRLPKLKLLLRKINRQKDDDALRIQFNDLDAPIEDAWKFIENNVIKPREEKGIHLMP